MFVWEKTTNVSISTGILVTSKENEIFENKVEEGIALLEQQARVYEAEERALRVLREEEVEDFERNENERRKKRKQKGYNYDDTFINYCSRISIKTDIV